MTDRPDDGFPVLSDTALSGLGLTPGEIAGAIEAAITAETAGQVWTTPKSALLPGDGRYLMTTLSASDTPRRTVVKSVMVSPRNPARGLPGVAGTITVQDSETGRLLAVMEAGWVTEMRTAALSAVAARRMARPDAARIAFIGCGAQARSHLATFAALFPLRTITAFGRGAANTERLLAEARALGLDATACETPRDAVAEADIVVSAVTLAFDLDPFVDARWLKPGAFAAITDVAAPWVPESLAAFDRIVIDDMAQERASARKMLDPALVTGDLGGLVAGDLHAGFEPATRSAFVFRGMAIGDFALACLALDRAVEAGAGTRAAW